MRAIAAEKHSDRPCPAYLPDASGTVFVVPQASTARITLPDRYRVVRHLANGGMASVWEAHDELLDRAVAVKVLATHLSEDDRARLRFEREARAAAGLSSHPNVVTIYDVGEHEDRVFMVMELMRGGSVADRLRSGKEIPHATVLDWLHEAAAALDTAHEANIVHRDIKPANLLLDERDRLAIADFGIARIAQEDQLTQTGQVLGTASYISPEQAMGEPASAASDRYSLAVVAYELLTGSRPFQGEHFAAQARAHVEDPPEPPSQRRPGLPTTLDAAVLRGLAKDPGDRWSSAGQMVNRIDEALEAAPPTESTRLMPPTAPAAAAAPAAVPMAAATPPPTGPSRSRRPAPAGGPRRSSGALLGALAGLILLAVIAVVLFSGGGNDSNQASHKPKPTATPAKKKPKSTPTAQATTTATATPAATATPSATPTAAGGTDLGKAHALQLQGFQANNAGDYARGAQLSKQALDACGGAHQLDPCGYAAYELGKALNRSGQPAAAIPYLEQRLSYGGSKEAEKELKDARKHGGKGGGD
jgi:serine/threonine protein kinase